MRRRVPDPAVVRDWALQIPLCSADSLTPRAAESFLTLLLSVTERYKIPFCSADSLTPRAAESFLALLLSVTERYKFLSATHHRQDFLQLQIDLIEVSLA